MNTGGNMVKNNNADIILDLIDLNRKKLKVLNQMVESENNNILGKEYNDLVKSYDVLYWFINKKYTSIKDEKKQELTRDILSLNPSLRNTCTIMELLMDEDNELIKRKIISDLGFHELILYEDDEKLDRKSILLKRLSSITGVDFTEESKGNTNTINSFMVSDLMNMIYFIISKDIGHNQKSTCKKDLIKLKYNLIYFSKDIEYRMVKNAFLVQDKPNLVNRDIIRTAGITESEYIEKFDDVIATILEKYILLSISTVYNNNLDRLDYCDFVFLRALSYLITDSELCECLILPPNEGMQDNIETATRQINEILLRSSQIDSKNRIYKRI